MRRIILLAALLLSLALTLIRFSPPSTARASAGGTALTPVTAPQSQGPRPIRTLPDLEEIRVWLGPNIVDYSFGPNHPALTERRVALDFSSFDMRPSAPEGRVQFYDIFYSNVEGSLDADGAYLTIEAVSTSVEGAGGGNVAEVWLKFSDSPRFFAGNAVVSFLALGNNANPVSISNAIDDNTQTYTTLGNTAGQSQRLRITIGFNSSSPLPTMSMSDISVTEGDTGTTFAVFTLTLETLSTLPVSVNFAADDKEHFGRDKAVVGSDYVSTSGTLTIPPGERSAQIRVPIIGDSVAEETESFRVTCRVVLSNLENVQGVAGASCTIFDNDRTVLSRCSGDLSLPVTNPSPLIATMSIAENIGIQKLTVGLFIETENVEDIRVELKSPSGVTGLIFAYAAEGRNIGAGCNPNELCVLDQEAHNSIRFSTAPFVGRVDPHGGYSGPFLNRFRDENARGDWTLIVTNLKGSNITTLRCWCLGFEGTLTGCVLKPNGLTFQTHTFVTPTATVLSNGAPVRGADVTFSIFDLDSTTPILRGTFGPFPTDQNGQAMMTPYTNSLDLFGPTFISLTQLIRAEVTINGTPFTARALIRWRGNDCPIATVEQGASQADATLTAAHGFRDEVLSQTSRGRKYTDQYYQFSSEAVQIMMFNPMLILRTREIIERYKPIIQSIVSGEEVTLTDGDLGEIDDFLKFFSSRGSSQLHEAIGGLRLDLRDPQVHSEFRIKSTHGPKREFPAGMRTATIKQVGFMTSLFGLFAFAISVTRIRRKRLSADLRRLTGLALVALLAGSQWPVADAKFDLAAPAAQSAAPKDHPVTTVCDDTGHGDLPMLFEVKKGQTDSKVKFLARGSGYDIVLTPTETVMILRREKAKSKTQNWEKPEKPAAHSSPFTDVLRMRLVGAATNPQVSGLDQLPAVSNYFIGSDERRWRAGVPAYGKVKYKGVYDGVDMIYKGSRGELEYAGNDGASSIAVDSAGNVYLTGVTSSQNFPTMNPLQASHGGGLFDGFVTKVNPSGRQLIYSTYLGGSGEDRAFRVAVDFAGNAYVTGDTDSPNFPTANALQRSIGGSVDAFVAKINAAGSAFVYSTYLGGSAIDGGTAIAVDSAGSAYATGFAGSANFPATNPIQQANGGGSYDAFVAKLSSSGAALEWSTYLGGSAIDAGFGIAVDSSGTAYVMGQTESTNFPTTSPLQPTNGGGASDLFITKIVPIDVTGPHIANASVSGKKLLVFGSGFDSGAKILLDGESQKTGNDEQNPTTALVAKKSGKKIAPGQTVTLQVRNSDGTLSNQFSFTK